MSPKAQLAKADRSHLARKTVSQTIPTVLKASARARAGLQSTQLLRDEDIHSSVSSSGTVPRPPIIRVIAQDTLQAAHDLLTSSSAKSGDRIAVLSMASELRPGGGFLSGANSQEESLCMRTTLYASLHEHFYRLPELGCVYTPDACVFRGRYGSAAGATVTDINPPTAWWFVNIISCAAVRGPDVDENDRYVNPGQRDLMREKIKRVLRVARMKGCRRLVLGAFGCGAFGNPSGEVAELFKRVLLGRGRKDDEFAGCFDEVVFAIKGGKQATFERFHAVLQTLG
ncbi:hypothetical protein Hypma_013341 [Hypsizygus marmoreus]|uniref:Microbial-type PARG catalytic domain-containing protein n=1 Tax=Hypsizygus marmoreus TaxID=39966 RepID=A0A369JEQ1_HYPMA|nr:hypothetical protein Hypma_013341 [Hypsizygus marmoreus]